MFAGLTRLPQRLAAWLARRRYPAIAIAAAGVTLASPALLTEPVADDLLHELLLRDQPGILGLRPQTVDLFRFATGDPADAHALMNEGVFAWWADASVRLAFFRPLAGLSHWLDWHWFAGRTWWMHVHSLLWLTALLAAVWAVYRRLAARPAALLALLLYAVDDSHAPAVGWIANRNASISLCFSLLALAAHVAWRQGGDGRLRWLVPALLCPALLAGETGVAGVGYLLAYAIFLEQGTFGTRALTLVGPALVVVAWRFIYLELGYGASGSGVYFDPGSDPVGFARAAVERLPILLVAAVAFPWADFWEIYSLVSPLVAPAVWCFAVLVLVGLGALFRRLLIRSRAARFWAAGMVFCALPAASTFPHDRLLLGVTVGWMALFAELLGSPALDASRLRHGAVSALVVIHLVLAPILLPIRTAKVDQLTGLMARASASLPPAARLERTTLVLVNPPVNPFAAYLPLYWEAKGITRPGRFLPLASGFTSLHVRRLDSRTLSLRPERGFLGHASELMLRSHARKMVLGETVRLDVATFEVTELTADGRPAQVAVRFEQSLDDPALVLMQWGHTGYIPFKPPAPGEAVTLPAANMLQILSG
jgi:hypothetical protein